LTPFSKLLLGSIDPQMLAGLLYFGAGLGLAAVHVAGAALGPSTPEAPLRWHDIPWLAAILNFPLLHLDSRADWTNWLQAVGLGGADVMHGPVLNRASMVIDAAINGQGVALARTTLAAWDLINGRLVRPFPESLRLSKTYWIICPKATATLPKIVTFREWLLAEASSDLRQLKKLGWSLRPMKEKGD
jgi:LysR family transcriptional regulator, glycine cleavage system transcriptional activator